jgi:hypothetical protein
MHPERAWRALLFLYILIPLATLSLSKQLEKYMRLVWGMAAVLLIILWKWVWLEFWAAWLFIFGIMLTLDQHNQLLKTKKHITIRVVASWHGLIFSMVVAVCGTLSIIARPNVFTVTCDQVHDAITTNIDRLLLPLRFTSTQVSNMSTTVDTFFTKSTDQLIQEQVSTQLTQKLGTIDTVASENPQVQGLLSSFKNMLIDTPLESKQDIDGKICNVVFDQIKTRYKKQWFKLSVFLTLVLFFYPLIRFFVFILSCIFSVFYRWLKKAWFIKVVEEEVIIEKREI